MPQFSVNSEEVERQAALVQQHVAEAQAEIGKLRTAIRGVEASANAVKSSADQLAGSWQGPAASNFQAAHADTHAVQQRHIEQGDAYSVSLDTLQQEIQQLGDATRSVGRLGIRRLSSAGRSTIHSG